MTDDELFAAFCASDLDPDAWHHEAHIRVAHAHLARFPLDEAHVRMRAGIIRLNAHHSLVETGARGYFETLTRVWLILVQDAARRTGATSSRQLLARAPELLDRAAPLRHYSRERLRTVRARAVFLEPDLTPLPDLEPDA